MVFPAVDPLIGLGDVVLKERAGKSHARDFGQFLTCLGSFGLCGLEAYFDLPANTEFPEG